jgi:hypothetical protein
VADDRLDLSEREQIDESQSVAADYDTTDSNAADRIRNTW